MASAVGTAAGFAAGGPIGAAIGGAIGGLIDQLWMPKLLSPTRQSVRAMDIGLSHATDGTASTLVFGEYARVPLHLTWTSRPWVVQQSGTDKRGIQAPDKWFVQAQWMAANNAIGEFDQIIAEGKRIYTKPITLSDSFTTGTEGQFYGLYANQLDPSYNSFDRMTIRNNQSGSGQPSHPDFAEFISSLDEGSLLTIVFEYPSGTSYPAFNARVLSSRTVDVLGNSELKIEPEPWLNPFTSPYNTLPWVIVNNIALGISSGVGVSMTNTPVQYDPKVFPGGASSLELKTTGVTKSSIMVSALGNDNVPKNRNRAYVVCDEFLLSGFGNRMPNMSAVVAGRTGFLTLRNALDYTCRNLTGVNTLLVNSDNVPEDQLDGMVVYGPFEPGEVVEKLRASHGVLWREGRNGAGSVYGEFFMDSDRTVNFIDYVGFNARLPSDEFEEVDLKLGRIDNNDRIRKVEVSFSNKFDSWQRGVETEELEHIALGKEVRVNLDDMVMTRAAAKSIARRMLHESWNRTYQIRWTATWEHGIFQEEDILGFSDDAGDVWTVIVDQIDETADFFVEITGWVIAPEQLASSPSSASSTNDNDPRYDEGLPRPPVAYTPLTTYVVDVPPLADEHVGQPGVYVAACNVDPTLAFQGAVVFVKRPSDQSWHAGAVIETAAVVGRTTDALASVAGTASYDTVNTVNVELEGIGELSTVTEAEVDDAINLALIGTEVVGFRDATLESDGTYTLDHLSRGRMATEDQVGTHAVAEPFVLLSGLTWLPLAAEDIGTTIEVKMVPPGATVDQVPAISYTVSLPTCVPVPPANLSVLDNGDGSLTASWTYRSLYTLRYRNPAQAPVPAGETVQVSAWNGSVSGAADYVVSVPASQASVTVTYPANEGLEGPTINAQVKQISPTFGASSAASASLSASYVPVVDLEGTILGFEAGTDSGGEFLVTKGNQETRWVRAANYGSIDNDFGSVADAASSVYDYGNI